MGHLYKKLLYSNYIKHPVKNRVFFYFSLILTNTKSGTSTICIPCITFRPKVIQLIYIKGLLVRCGQSQHEITKDFRELSYKTSRIYLHIKKHNISHKPLELNTLFYINFTSKIHLFFDFKKMDIAPFKDQMQKALNYLENEFKTLQLGRASSGLLENVTVHASY